MAKYFLLLVLIALSYSLLAQQEGRMETDRPDQTESPVITKKKYIQTEIGFGVLRDNDLSLFVHPTILWKYGLSKRLELRLITDFVSLETPILIPVGNDVISGLLPLQIGGKVAFWEEKGLLPKTSLLFHIAPSRLGSKKFHTSKWAPDLVLAFQNSLSKTVGLGYNIGTEWDGESDTPYLLYSLSSGFNIGKKWYSYIEIFGAARKSELPQNNFDAGLAYYFSDNTKIDISSGFGLSNAAPDWYCAIGFSLRFNTSKRKQ
jgi:hypothetical protein